MDSYNDDNNNDDIHSIAASSNGDDHNNNNNCALSAAPAKTVDRRLSVELRTQLEVTEGRARTQPREASRNCVNEDS